MVAVMGFRSLCFCSRSSDRIGFFLFNCDNAETFTSTSPRLSPNVIGGLLVIRHVTERRKKKDIAEKKRNDGPQLRRSHEGKRKVIGKPGAHRWSRPASNLPHGFSALGRPPISSFLGPILPPVLLLLLRDEGRIYGVHLATAMTGSSALPSGKGPNIHHNDPSRTSDASSSTTLSPASQLTPEASSSDGSDPAHASAVAGGRGPSLQKLQTDLAEYEDDGDSDGHEQHQTGGRGRSDSIDFDLRSDDDDDEDDDYFYRERRRRRGPYSGSHHVPVSRSYTVEEEKRVVRKFDRRLTLFVACLYMLAFLDRSSESFPMQFYIYGC
jgi:hypothetical protein